jgi:hypothetical protein
MPGHNRNSKNRHLLWVMLGLFCCALITLGGIVQVVHTHADGHAVQSDCALCHTAHQVIQAVIPHFPPRTERVVARVVAAPQLTRTQTYFVFSLFTRPPPQTANS